MKGRAPGWRKEFLLARQGELVSEEEGHPVAKDVVVEGARELGEEVRKEAAFTQQGELRLGGHGPLDAGASRTG